MDFNTNFEVMDKNLEQDAVLITKEEYNALKEKAEETEELHDKLLRLQAEFENYKKFIERQKLNWIKFGNEKLLKQLLTIYDDLKRALNGHSDSPFAPGIKLILSNISALLKTEGIEPIQAEGALFNPEIHECMMVEQNPSAPEGAITEVFEEGYFLNEKVLRPAKVKINNK